MHFFKTYFMLVGFLALSLYTMPTYATKPAKKVSTQKSHSIKSTHRAKSTTYKSTKKVKLSNKELDCLARNIYHEARGEPYAGKLAVAQVTWNRVQSKQWGSSVCSVVYAPYQFSWTNNPHKRYASPKNADWQESRKIAQDYVKGVRVNKLDNATHFHANYLSKPAFTRGLRKLLVVGNHIFYG